MDIIIVLCTYPNLESARQIGTALVEAQLAACVNLCPIGESIYRWKGKIQYTQEAIVLIKTTRQAYPRLEALLIKLHPYDIPEIIALPTEQVLPAYAAWIQESVTISADSI